MQWFQIRGTFVATDAREDASTEEFGTISSAGYPDMDMAVEEMPAVA